MSDKNGYSEEKTDFWGNKYTQHYDADGNKIGHSEEKTDFWGDKYTQHHDQAGSKTGHSEEKTDFWGDKYTQHYHPDGSKGGYSETKTDFWGDKYVQGYNESGSKTGYSEKKTDFWGDKYTQHYGDASSNPSRHAGVNRTSGGISRKRRGSPGAAGKSDSSLAGIFFGLLMIGFVVLLCGSLFSSTVKTYSLNSARSIANYPYNGSMSSALQPPVNFIRTYYEDLNRHDLNAVTTKWKAPPGNLRTLVKNIEWIKVNSLRQVYTDSTSSKIEIEVDGKALDRNLEKWSGIIEVEKINGKWKISKMNLKAQATSTLNSTLNGYFLVEQLTSFSGFYPQNGTTQIPMLCNYCHSFKVKNGILQIAGFGHLWTENIVYDLSKNNLLLEAIVRLHASTDNKCSEFIVGFSQNRQPWGRLPDALSFRLGCNKDDPLQAALRTGMYSKYLRNDRAYIPADKWATVKILLSKDLFVSYIDKKKVSEVSLANVVFPRVGYIGLLGYNNIPTEIRSLKISMQSSM